MIFACGIVPTLNWTRKRSCGEELVLVEDLLDDLLGIADEVRAARVAAAS